MKTFSTNTLQLYKGEKDKLEAKLTISPFSVIIGKITPTLTILCNNSIF